MTTIKTNAGGSSDVTLDDGSQTTAKNTVTISGNIKFTNSVYSQVTLSDGKQTTAMNVVDLSGGGGTDAVTSVNGVQPVDGNVEITGDNISATVGEEEATITQHLTALKNDEAEKVNIAQGAENAGKVMTVGEDGNVVPTAGYATQSWVETQITNSIGSIETALAEV